MSRLYQVNQKGWLDMIITYSNVRPDGTELSYDNMLETDKKILILLFEQLNQNADEKPYEKGGVA